MKTAFWYPNYIFINKSIYSHSVTERILSRCHQATVYPFDSIDGESDEKLIRRVFYNDNDYSLQAISKIARKSLLLYENNEVCEQMSAGKVEERRCYNFLEILPYEGVCRGNCGYCWFNEPVLIPKVNVVFFDKLPEFLRKLSQLTSLPVVLTFTHHRTDCFAIEHLTDFVRTAADFFEKEKQFYVQFLTKSNNVESLLQKPPLHGTIVCFTVNSPIVSDEVEIGTASVTQRLNAARQLSEVGIPVLLRIDPMLAVGKWDESYKELVKLIFERFTPQQITLGTPRFQSEDEMWSVASSNMNNRVRSIMEEQSAQMTVSKPGIPKSDDTVNLNYYFKNMPVSYPKELRIELYKNVIDECLKHDFTSIGLCEEPAEIWEACKLKWTGNKAKDCTCNFIPNG